MHSLIRIVLNNESCDVLMNKHCHVLGYKTLNADATQFFLSHNPTLR